jgi:hypothetical protein
VGVLLAVLLVPGGLPGHGLPPAPGALPRAAAGTASTGPDAAARPGGPGAPSTVPLHPGPLRSPRVSVQGHYYAGAAYEGTNTTATELAVDIEVPQDVPQSGDFYYVLLSAFDDGQSYDQVGFANDMGVWGVSYSTSSPCGSTYYFSPDAYNLSAGTTYRFGMSISLGTVTFTVAPLGGSAVWSYSATTGGRSFVLSEYYQCESYVDIDYTDYEEVDQTTAPEPPYDFVFANNTAGTSPVDIWGPLYASAPAAISVAVQAGQVLVENEPFNFHPVPTLDVEPSGASREYDANVTLGALNGSTSLTVTVAGAVPNSTVGLSPSSGDTPFTFRVDVDLANATASGTYDLELQAIAGSGSYCRITLVVDVVRRLTASAPVLSEPGADVNESETIHEAVVGGAGTLHYTWTGLPGNCTAPAATVTCLPNATGSFGISVVVRDSLGFRSASPTVTLVVAPALTVSGAVSASSIDLGQSVSFSARVHGGSGGAHFAWTESPPTACDVAGANLTCVPFEVGSLNVSVAVTDANGAVFDLRPTTVVVLSDPNASLTATPSKVDVGQGIDLVAYATGGSGGYRWSWIDLPGHCGNTTLAEVNCRANRSALFPVLVQVTDSNGFVATSPTTLLYVYPDPSVSLNLSATSILVGDGLAMAATPSGGLGPFTFAWSGLPGGCVGASARSLSCNPSAAGTYRIEVELTDALGGNASNASTVTVAPSLLGLPFDEGLAVIGGGMALVAAVTAGALYLRFRRRGTRSPPEAEAAPPDA